MVPAAASPDNASSDATSADRFSPRARARSFSSAITSSTTDAGSHRTRSIVIRPASIFERSRMSLTTPSRCVLLCLIVSVYCRCSSGSQASSSSRSVKPMIAVIGVRISWLMLARNALLAWLARSASALAWLSSSVAIVTRCSSSWLRSTSDSRSWRSSRLAPSADRNASRFHPNRQVKNASGTSSSASSRYAGQTNSTIDET